MTCSFPLQPSWQSEKMQSQVVSRRACISSRASWGRLVGPRPLAGPAPKRLVVQPLNVATPAQDAAKQKHSSNGHHAQSEVARKDAASEASSSSNGHSDMTATLLLQCPDTKGVIAALSQLLYGFNCNILSSDQFTDTNTGMFFQRVTFDYSDIIIGSANTQILERAISELARRFDMKWKVSYRSQLKRVALLVSKLDHCLYDLLIRHKSGELKCEIPIIVSNHPDLKHIADMFEVPFRHLPLTDKANKAAQEAEIEKVLHEMNIDVIILARYMQIFSHEFCQRHWEHTINIHHSFLPAFEGARPYHRAHERGVKIIGATAHYATAELDAGPIIDQHTTRITHRDSVSDMIRKGRDLERLVLARAVRWHLDDRVLVYGNKTVVFED